MRSNEERRLLLQLTVLRRVQQALLWCLLLWPLAFLLVTHSEYRLTGRYLAAELGGFGCLLVIYLYRRHLLRRYYQG